MKHGTILSIGVTLLLGILACRIVPVQRHGFGEISQLEIAGINNPGSGAPARIIAETINLDAPVVSMGWHVEEKWGQVVAEWDVPDSEAAWHANSARPGEGSNVVISGHNNSLGGRVFANLEELTVGDQVTLWNDRGNPFVYQVRERKLIRALGASPDTQELLQMAIEPTANERLTLITCWPSWSNTHRLIIIADPRQG
ncbi:MAG: sortase [Anaerolineae bacterium]|nr:sortase [Anaerolineae bacterium]